MTAKHLIATLTLTLAAGATFAAIKHGQTEAPNPVAVCAESSQSAIARVVVTARRDRALTTEAPVARVVVTARRTGSNSLAAASN